MEKIIIPIDENTVLKNVQNLLDILEKPITQEQIDNEFCLLVHEVRRKIGISLVGFFTKNGLNFFVNKIKEKFPELKVLKSVEENIQELINLTNQTSQEKVLKISEIEQKIEALKKQKDKLKNQKKNLEDPSDHEYPSNLIKNMATGVEKENFAKLLLTSDKSLTYLGSAIDYVPEAERKDLIGRCFARIRNNPKLLIDNFKEGCFTTSGKSWSTDNTISCLINNGFGDIFLDFLNVSEILNQLERRRLIDILAAFVQQDLGKKMIQVLNLDMFIEKILEKEKILSKDFLDPFIEKGLIEDLLKLKIFEGAADNLKGNKSLQENIFKIKAAAEAAELMTEFDEKIKESNIAPVENIWKQKIGFKKIKK